MHSYILVLGLLYFPFISQSTLWCVVSSEFLTKHQHMTFFSLLEELLSELVCHWSHVSELLDLLNR